MCRKNGYVTVQEGSCIGPIITVDVVIKLMNVVLGNCAVQL